MKFRTFLWTDPGDRENNEDSAGYRVRPWHSGVFAVADGLGGHDAGEVASATATRCLIDRFSGAPSLAPDAVEQMFAAANDAVYAAQGEAHTFYSMKTTLAAAFYRRGRVVLAHVGDSRIYLFRKRKLCLRTRDHSLAQLLVEQGKLAPDALRRNADRNQLLRAMGSTAARPTVSETLRLRRGDALLLCTDGFWENLDDCEIEAALGTADSPEAWVRAMLTRHANARRERQDNFTALAVFAE